MYFNLEAVKLVHASMDYLRSMTINTARPDPKDKTRTRLVKGTIGVEEHSVLLTLARRSKNGTCFPSIKRIAKESFISERSVNRALELLAAADVISVSKRPHRNQNLYNLRLLPENAQWEEPERDEDYTPDSWSPEGERGSKSVSLADTDDGGTTNDGRNSHDGPTAQSRQNDATNTTGWVDGNDDVAQEVLKSEVLKSEGKKTNTELNNKLAVTGTVEGVGLYPVVFKGSPDGPRVNSPIPETQIPRDTPQGRLSRQFYEALLRPPQHEVAAATTWLPILTTLLERYCEDDISWAFTWIVDVDEFWLPKLRTITKEDPLVWFSSPDRAHKIIARASAARPKAASTTMSTTTGATDYMAEFAAIGVVDLGV